MHPFKGIQLHYPPPPHWCMHVELVLNGAWLEHQRTVATLFGPFVAIHVALESITPDLCARFARTSGYGCYSARIQAGY